MTGFQNPYMNPYGFVQPNQYQQYQAQTQVVKVNGENGARAYQMGANGSALLLDESGLIVWLVTSDGAGYKTVTAYDITPHQESPKPDFGSLESRIQRLEDIVNGNARNTSAVGKEQSNDAVYPTDDRHGKQFTEPTGYDESTVVEQPKYETGNGRYQPVRR